MRRGSEATEVRLCELMKPIGENTVISAQEILLYLSQDRFMSKREAASYTSLSIRNLESRLDEIPHYRVGRKILFKKSELDHWMESHREGGSHDLDKIADDAVKTLREGG